MELVISKTFYQAFRYVFVGKDVEFRKVLTNDSKPVEVELPFAKKNITITITESD